MLRNDQGDHKLENRHDLLRALPIGFIQSLLTMRIVPSGQSGLRESVTMGFVTLYRLADFSKKSTT